MMFLKITCLFFTLILLPGCGSELADVQGQVTHDGQPVVEAVVYYLPENGPQAQGTLDAEGHYRLTTPGRGDGAIVGKHRISIVPSPSQEEELNKESFSEDDYVAGKLPKRNLAPPNSVIPRQMMSPNTSTLVREIKPGNNEFDFNLSQE